MTLVPAKLGGAATAPVERPEGRAPFRSASTEQCPSCLKTERAIRVPVLSQLLCIGCASGAVARLAQGRPAGELADGLEAALHPKRRARRVAALNAWKTAAAFRAALRIGSER